MSAGVAIAANVATWQRTAAGPSQRNPQPSILFVVNIRRDDPFWGVTKYSIEADDVAVDRENNKITFYLFTGRVGRCRYGQLRERAIKAQLYICPTDRILIERFPI